jgi:hypothetical protein
MHLCVFVLKLSVKSAKSVWHYHSLFLFFSLYAIGETKTSSLCLKGYSFMDKERDSLYIYGCDRFFFFYCNILFRKRRCLTYFFFFSFSPPPLTFSFSSLLFFGGTKYTYNRSFFFFASCIKSYFREAALRIINSNDDTRWECMQFPEMISLTLILFNFLTFV